MTCPYCESTATTERPERTELGYHRFRCRDCQREFNELTGTPFKVFRRMILHRNPAGHDGVSPQRARLAGMSRLDEGYRGACRRQVIAQRPPLSSSLLCGFLVAA